MSQDHYRYAFNTRVPAIEIEATLLIAIVAAEALHGPVPVRLEAGHVFDPKRRVCVVDATTKIGQDFNRMFVGLVVRQFGQDAFAVERVDGENHVRKSQRVRARA